MKPPPVHRRHLAATAPPGLDDDRQVLQIRFTGHGAAYFGVWAGNLLRLLLTLGLYAPFARARRLRYLYANTLVDGHALCFHAVVAWAPGAAAAVVAALLALAMALPPASHLRLASAAAAVAGVLLATLWPLLWWATLRHQLAQTSWRGLRLRFDGDVAGAYRALLPQWLPAALLLVLSSVPTPPGRPGGAGLLLVYLLSGLAMLAMLPLTLARSARYRQAHCWFADEHSRMTAPTAAFYRLALALGLVGLVGLVVLALLGLLLGLVAATAPPGLGLRAWAGGAAAGGSARTLASMLTGTLFASTFASSHSGAPAFALLLLAAVLAAVLVLLLALAAAGLQNLVWGHTRSARVRFDSQLDPWALVAVAGRNTLWMLLTLGLYRPFAQMHSARLRLQAMQVVVRGDPSQWRSGPARLAPHKGGQAGANSAGPAH